MCSVCGQTRTRAGMCRQCFYRKAGTTEVRYEAIIESVLEFFFGAAAVANRRVLIAGRACTSRVDGDNCEGGKTKGNSRSYSEELITYSTFRCLSGFFLLASGPKRICGSGRESSSVL